MAACSKYKNRLKQALEHRGLGYPTAIIGEMGKRAKTDRSLDKIINDICSILEPPYCQKSHCPSHTAYAFCGCSKKLVPGKCPLNLEYLKRKREREATFRGEMEVYYGQSIADERWLGIINGYKPKEAWDKFIAAFPVYDGLHNHLNYQQQS